MTRKTLKFFASDGLNSLTTQDMFSSFWPAKLYLIFLLALSACGDRQNDRTKNSQPADIALQGHISIWKELPDGVSETQGSEHERILRRRLESFARLNPGVKISLEIMSSGESFSPFIRKVERGAGPNLLWLAFNRESVRLIGSGSLKALDGHQIALSSFAPETLQQVRYRGKLYGIPTNLETQVLCYNRDKVGQFPDTLSELIAQARAGYSVGLHSGFDETFWGTGIFSDRIFDRRGRFTAGEGWARWMAWLKKARNEPNFFLVEGAGELQKLFVEKKLAYITCRSGWIPALREALGSSRLGIALLPHATNRPATPPVRAHSLLFNRASSPKQTQIALKLAQFLTNAEQQEATQLALPFTIPVNVNVTADRRLYPLQATLSDQARSGIALPLARLGQLSSQFDSFDFLYRKVLAGQIAPAEAAAELAKTLDGWDQEKPEGGSP
jgi:maltose-binding protein MalE